MNFRKVNNLTGWIVCAIASLVYILTAEKSGSFWDCGEFVSACYKVQLPHPPGAPLFVLLGRFFIVLFGDHPENAAKAVNIMNALASGFTILFLFWTITHFARKLMIGFKEEPDTAQIITIMGAGIVGALAYTFTDSFWFSAVEGEVYAFSSFFTGLVFWLILKWERAADAAGGNRVEQARADRWMVLISFMMGLSIGVHLLGLLTIPAIVMVYYYKRYEYTLKGAIIAFIIGIVITGLVQVVVIQSSIKWAGKFDIFFVNSLHLPFFSGFIFFFILLGVLCWLGLRWARTNSWSYLRLGIWCFIFMMLGYSTYVTTMERSNANPAIDMNNVDNPMNLVYYLGRDQYGTQPLLFGPYFTAKPAVDEETGQYKYKEGAMRYTKYNNAYVPIGRTQEPEYDVKDEVFFPRVWDSSNDQGHADFYADWLGLDRNPQTGEVTTPPTYAQNIQWFITYQMGLMYWRYFMWNFSGRQNDIQGYGNRRDGNWISGISFIDNARLGDQSKMPDSIKNNGATNKLYLLPFILGIIGCIYQFLSDRRDWIVTFLLFFMTGLAIVLYLNQPGNQPRERDYAYAGSFYAYAIWIGLAVVAFVRMARKAMDGDLYKNILIYGSITTFLICILSDCYLDSGSIFLPSIFVTIIFAVLVTLIVFIIRAISSSGKNLRNAAVLATLICLVAPIIMGFQEWDDHDRSQKTLAPDVAKDYLNSCAPNAILFTFGDNDTYPLWYAQEVEGVRRDIRIINTSLLGIDWYVNQLRYKVNLSDPIDVIWSPEQVLGLSYILFRPQGPQDKAYPLYDVMKNVVGPQLTGEDKTQQQATFPVKHFTVPVVPNVVRSNGTVNVTDTVLNEIRIDLPESKTYLTLDQLTMLNIIAANNWKRPIYFTSPGAGIGIDQYLRKDGLTYRLVPVKNSFPQRNWVIDQMLRGTSIRDNNSDVMYNNLMTKFRSGGADQIKNGKAVVYYDEENRRHLLSIRSTFAEAAGNLADAGRKAEANNLLNRAEQLIKPEALPYAMVGRSNSHNQTSLIYLEAAFKAGNTQLADKLRAAIRKDLTDQRAYYNYLRTEKEAAYNSLQREAEINEYMFNILDAMEKHYTQGVKIVTEAPGQQQIKPADTSTSH
ncbi:MAG: DUF2723 domain-containing protein [Chitinophagaceae bacterium]